MGLVRNWRPALKEKLVYISADNVVYDLHNPLPNSVLTMEGWGLADADYATTRGPFQDGLTVLSTRLAQRVIKVDIRQRGCDRVEYWEHREGLINILRQNRSSVNFPQPGKLRWYRADEKIRQADVFIKSGPKFKPTNGVWDNFSYTDTLEFIAYNPIIYDPTQVNSSVLDFTCVTTNQLEFPFLFSSPSLSFGVSTCVDTQAAAIFYDGKWVEYPVINVHGPATNTRIVHDQTGAILELDYSIGTTEVVTFDLTYARKTVENNMGSSLLNYLSADSTLGSFSLEPDPIVANGLNTFTITIQSGSGTTYVEFLYYNRYPGI